MKYFLTLLFSVCAMPSLAQGLKATTQQYGPAPEIQQQYNQEYQQQPQQQYQQPQQYYQQQVPRQATPQQYYQQQAPQQYYQQQPAQQQGMNGYPAGFIQQYTQTCVRQPVKTPIPLQAGLKESYCGCMADGVMRRVSYRDFQIMDQIRTEADLQRVPQSVMNAFQNVASSCFVSTGAKMFFGQ